MSHCWVPAVSSVTSFVDRNSFFVPAANGLGHKDPDRASESIDAATSAAHHAERDGYVAVMFPQHEARMDCFGLAEDAVRTVRPR
ncbi:hypothetical protein [Fuerstiella marisgermanici]|uniref:hypothetical protein n=1 Tax=Fuerstiella marisgermanici TaxID=1891926 RepID=UPI00097BEE24|nr:hypothetical protein [Fuerstiella marisgermanici]